MPETETNEVTWDFLDQRAVKDLVERKGADGALDALTHEALSPQDRAQALVDQAIQGNILALKESTSTLKAWSDEHGLRRLSNSLVELERVLGLSARGQAILQAQALTRFISLHIETDIASLKQAITNDNS